MIDFIFNIDDHILDYDFESYPNAFTACFMAKNSDRVWTFEISDRRNDLDLFCLFIDYCNALDVEWEGFNNMGYDWPIANWIYKNRGARLRAQDIYAKSCEIIETPWNDRFNHTIWGENQIVRQIDLMRIHHFDNVSKTTSLKALEFCLRSPHLQELPFPPGTVLTSDEIDVVIDYNFNDVLETKRFGQHSEPMIQMRRDLGARMNLDLMNLSDTSIGEKILLKKLEEKGVKCTTTVDGKQKKLQTDRAEEGINLGSVIFPYVQLEHPEFQKIVRLLHEKTVHYTTKGLFDDLIANVGGVHFKFGTGGLHGSVEGKVVKSCDRFQLVDVDVSSYYPNLGIKNGLYPAHLGPRFCDVYDEIYLERQQHPKGTPENEAFKLALNGAYGKSNSDYSALKDPRYTMSITINGQLLLAMFVEQLIKAPGLQMVQANTDGITYLCPREHLEWTLTVLKWWEDLTKLTLEEVHYDSMFIRDVNSYIAVKEDGKVKRIGAYAYESAAENPGTRELPWHKDWSFRIVQMAAEAHLVHGRSIRDFITQHTDYYNFMGRTKVPKSSKLLHGESVVPNTIRYMVTKGGAQLTKLMPATGPEGQYKKGGNCSNSDYLEHHRVHGNVWDENIHTANKSVHAERRIGINTGWNVTIFDTWTEADAYWAADGIYEIDLDYEFYIQAAEKLVNLQEMQHG